MAIAKKIKQEEGISLPLGNHIALLSGVIHLGVQRNTYNNEESLKDQILLQFELQDELLPNGAPLTVSKTINNSASGPKSGLVLVGKAFGVDMQNDGLDFEAQLGKPVLLEIKPQEKDKSKQSVGAVSPLPKVLKGSVKPLVTSPKIYFDVEEITPTQLEELPPWIVNIIAKRISEPKENKPSSHDML